MQLGVPVTAIQEAIQKQNDMASAGFFETGTDRIQLRVSGHLHSVDDLKKCRYWSVIKPFNWGCC